MNAATGFWPLFGRELRAHRLLLAGSLAIGLLVALVPSLPGAHTSRAVEVRGAAAAVAAGLWSLVLAIGLGAAAVTRDLRESRLGFDFRLPAGVAAIGGARLLAALLVTVGSGALVLAIPQAFGVDFGFLGGWMPFAPLALVLLFLLAHATTLSVAGSRAWLTVDFAALCLVGLAIWLAWRPFYRYYVPAGEVRLGVVAAALLALALLAAIAFQLRAGRSELDRAHRAFSRAFAAGAIAVALGTAGYARWYFSPGVESLRAPKRSELGAGWTLTTGAAGGRPGAAFAILRHQPSGRTLAPIPTPAPGFFRPYARVAADGSRLAWLEIGEGRRDLELWTLDARDPAAQPRLALDGLEWSQEVWALSPDGSRTVSVGRLGDAQRLYVDEVATGRRLATLALPGIGWVRSLEFSPPETAHGIAWERADGDVVPRDRPFTIDLASGQLTVEGRE